ATLALPISRTVRLLCLRRRKARPAPRSVQLSDAPAVPGLGPCTILAPGLTDPSATLKHRPLFLLTTRHVRPCAGSSLAPSAGWAPLPSPGSAARPSRAAAAVATSHL